MCIQEPKILRIILKTICDVFMVWLGDPYRAFFMHWDSVHNNASYMSYNGKHFMPGLMDLDNTISLDDRNINDFFITEDIWTKFQSPAINTN